LALGCGEASDEEPTYSEALEAYNIERQELERLQKERVAMEQQFETAKNKLRAIEAKRQAVGKEDYQRAKELDPDQAREYLEQRETGDAEIARQVGEGIGKLTAQHAEDVQQLQEKILRQEERVKRARAVLDKAKAAQAE
jgi:hypothetical protein